MGTGSQNPFRTISEKSFFPVLYFDQFRCAYFLIFLPRSQNVFTLFSVSQQASDVEQRLLIVWKSCKQCRVHCRQIKLICCGSCTVRGQQSDVVALEACHRGGPCRTTAVARPCLAERPFAVLECGRRADEVQQAGSTCLIDMPLQDSRTAFKTSQLLRKVRLTTLLHKAWADAAYMRRYLVATRKHFINGLSYKYTCDKNEEWERLAGRQSAGAFSRHHRLVRACGRKLRN